MTNRSSSPVRLCTKWCPSKASSSPAVQPSSVEPSSRRPIRATIRIDSVPQTADAKRHPNELVCPNSSSPSAIIHLPTGGCTTKSAAVPHTLVVPLVKRWSAVVPRLGATDRS
jgi:hypothetical protein